MAISPPSDILLDVANAADPAKVRAATERLAKLANDPTLGEADFSKALAKARADGKVSGAPSAAPTRTHTAASGIGSAGLRPSAKAGDGKNTTYQKFEAVMLQSFVEAMLPKDDETFGDKASAGAYRSMMAEQLATQLAKAGGIGIAKAVEHAHPQTLRHTKPV